MKKIIGQLKQPTKFTHQFLKRKEEDQLQDQQKSESNQQHTQKTKIINKQKRPRKVITKPNEPSALRLEQINRTFDNLQQKSSNFLSDLSIDHELLESLVHLQQKFECDCKRRVKYYCLKCKRYCKQLDLAKIPLPLAVHVIHHTSEKINKSSVAPMQFLTQSIHFYPFTSNQLTRDKQNQQDVFDRLPKSGPTTYILYPHKKSKSLKQIQGPIDSIILLDCTWFQTDQLIENLQEKGYNNFIKLQGYQSVFWRYNHYSQAALSTAQSLLYFFRENQQRNKQSVKQYDPLLLLYALNLRTVTKSIPHD